MSEIIGYSVACAVVFILTYGGVEYFRRWSLRRALLDVPNERSSHSTPTPRGGGAVIVVVCLSVFFIYTLCTGKTSGWAYLSGALMIALISWLDDLYSISFVWRFAVHAFAAGLVIAFVGFFGDFYLPLFQTTIFGFKGGILITFFYIVWLTNAYNFMDGIDGIAGLQAVIAGAGWLLIGQQIGLETTVFYGGVVAAASGGFLLHNWQPAKIFMGDVGSAFLGFTLAVLPLLSLAESAASGDKTTPPVQMLPAIAVWLNWLFISDTVFTMGRRALQGKKFWAAHRGHLYQKLVINGFSHRTISTVYGALSASIIFLTILWIFNKDIWEPVIISMLIGQFVGLVFYVRILGDSVQQQAKISENKRQ